MSQRIHLDATPGLFHQVLHCHQGDVGRQFEIAVVTRDGYEIPSGATFKIQATKPSGLGFTVTGTAANNIISFTSTEDMTSEAGEIPTQLEIKSGNDVIYTSNFLLVCETNVHPSSVTDGSPEEIISEITLLVERAESAASTAGADAAAAAQARVDEMMNYLPTEVTNLKSDLVNITGNEVIPFTRNAFINTSGSTVDINTPTASSTGYAYAVVPCEKGDMFRISGVGGASPRLWCFIDEDGNSLSVAAESASASNLLLVAPEDSAHLVINDKSNATSFIGDFLHNDVEQIEESLAELGIEDATISGNIIDLEHITLTTASANTAWGDSGTKQTYAGFTAINEPIDVMSGKTYSFAGMYGNQYSHGYAMLYKDGLTDGIQKVCNVDPKEIIIPVGYTKVCLTMPTDNISDIDRIQIIGDVATGGKFFGNVVVDKENFAEKLLPILLPFDGKTIVNFGDSIFGQARPPLDVSTILAEKTGATTYNVGFGGCQMGYHGSPQYDAFSMYRLADAVANNDWSVQDDAIANYPSLPSYFAGTVALLKSIDFSDVDIVTISYGTNDFTNGLKIGGANSYSVDWALDYSIQTLLTAFTNLRIFVCLPMYRVWLDNNNTFDYDSNTATHTSWVDSVTRTFKDFVEAERDVAKANQLPIIDTYYDLGINQYNWTQYFPSTDGTHHNLEGRKLIAKLIAHDLWA